LSNGTLFSRHLVQ